MLRVSSSRFPSRSVRRGAAVQLLSARSYAHVAQVTPTQPTPSSPASSASAPPPRATPKKVELVDEFFSNLGSSDPPFPQRYAELKKEIVGDRKDAIVHAWRAVLRELEGATEEIARRGSEMILQVPYKDIERGLSEEQLKILRKTGVLIVKGGVPKEEALGWLQSLKNYVADNSDKVKGAPADKLVFYEIYNAKAQLQARTHPALLTTQKYLLSLWHASDPATPIDLRTPVSYFDRFRIRAPGPSAFTLGPHTDGGSIEQWEDPPYRNVWARILEGGEGWRGYDPFDVSSRLDANHNLHNAANECSVFRPWQGWTALSHTGPGEGTLCVLPSLSLATAYIILRPFFRLASARQENKDITLDADAWELDLDDPTFPGSTLGKTQAINATTHPHLRLDKTVVPIPRVEPGDQVYWHCDVVHAVEAEHNGKEDSSVMYIGAVPLTERNAALLRDQRETFVNGLPPPDFPRGEGESRMIGRGTLDDLLPGPGHPDARRVLGFEPFPYESCANDGERRAVAAANEILGFAA